MEDIWLVLIFLKLSGKYLESQYLTIKCPGIIARILHGIVFFLWGGIKNIQIYGTF